MKKIIFFLLFPMFCFSQFTVPQRHNNTFVNDYTNILTVEQKQNIDSIIIKIRKESSVEIAVVLLNDFQHLEIEDVAHSIFRTWGIGKKQINNGLLYIISPALRKGRIEVGLGLEGKIPDIFTAQLQDNAKPYYRNKDYYGGIISVLTGVYQELSPTFKQQQIEYKQRLEEDSKRKTQEFFNALLNWGGSFLIICLLIWYFISLAGKRKLKKEKLAKEKENIEILKQLFETISKYGEEKLADIKKYSEQLNEKYLTFYPKIEQAEEAAKSLNKLILFKKTINYNNPEIVQLYITQINKYRTNLNYYYIDVVTILNSFSAAKEYLSDNEDKLRTLYQKANENLSKTPYTEVDLRTTDYLTLRSKKYKLNQLLEMKTLMQALMSTYSKIVNYVKPIEQFRTKTLSGSKRNTELSLPTAVVIPINNDYNTNNYTPTQTSSTEDYSFSGGDSGGGGSNSEW